MDTETKKAERNIEDDLLFKQELALNDSMIKTITYFLHIHPLASIYDDVCQEIRLAILTAPAGMTKRQIQYHAKGRAIDYLKSKKNYYSYGGKYEPMRLKEAERMYIDVETKQCRCSPEPLWRDR